MQDALFNQGLALPAKSAAVFFLNGRRLDHRTHPRFAALVGQQRAKQRLAVDPVGLGPSAAARGRDRGRIDDVAFNPFLLQHAVNPEAVQTRFLNDDDRQGFTGPRKCLTPQLCKARQ
jgi:hypothetical protein